MPEVVMTQGLEQLPIGAQPVDGVVHRRSPVSVAETVERLTEAIERAGGPACPSGTPSC
jgi:hypothetical protein